MNIKDELDTVWNTERRDSMFIDTGLHVASARLGNEMQQAIRGPIYKESFTLLACKNDRRRRTSVRSPSAIE